MSPFSSKQCLPKNINTGEKSNADFKYISLYICNWIWMGSDFWQCRHFKQHWVVLVVSCFEYDILYLFFHSSIYDWPSYLTERFEESQSAIFKNNLLMSADSNGNNIFSMSLRLALDNLFFKYNFLKS